MGFLHLIRHNRRHLLVTGAVTVFTTFVVKDGLRENAKVRVDALERAQIAFQDAIERNQDRTTLVEISLAIEALSYPKAGATGNTSESVFEAEDQRAFEEQVGGSLAIVDKLKSSLPGDPNVDELEKSAEESFKKVIAAHSQLAHEFDEAEGQHLKQAPAAEMAAADQCRHAHEDAWLAVVNLSRNILQDAEVETNWWQKAYRIFSWLSYGLYIAGLVIGLVGEFAKEEKPVSPG